jgi:SRSO17 transposase
MDSRFAARRDELLADAEVAPQILRRVLPRLERFLDPFVALLQRSPQDEHAHHYVAGLVSDLECKNVESIAYLFNQEPDPLQRFIGQSPWDYRPWITALARQVGQQLGSPDGVLVFDPSAFAKKGTASVGVQRQWCGRLGKVENCQVGVYLGYVGRTDHALVDVRLYLPREWTGDRPRCRRAGVPRSVHFQTRHQLALEMLQEHGQALPHRWSAGDDEMGRCTAFRRSLDSRQERYLLAVPSNTLIRDLEVEAPPYPGRGRRPVVPFRRADVWRAAVPETAWTELTVRDGDKGPLVVQVVK